MPTWLKDEYHRIRDRLSDEMTRNASHTPTCYDRQMMYECGENKYLTVAASYDGSFASTFHRPRYFIWLPHLLVHQIPCPACKAAGREGVRGPVVYLTEHGFVDSPRRVVDIEDNLFIIGYRYRCPHPECGQTFQSWSDPILGALPPAVAGQFTFRLTYRSGLTEQLATLLRETIRGGLGPQVFTTMIQAFHYCALISYVPSFYSWLSIAAAMVPY